MKSFCIPMALLLVILGCSLWTCSFVEQRTTHWSDMLSEVEELARQEDWSRAEERLRAAYADWDDSQTLLHILLEHDELDEAESLFSGAFAACREEDDADFHLLLAQLTEQLRLLAETQSVSIKNIL